MSLKERANLGLHDYLFHLVRQNQMVTPGQHLLDIGCGTGAWLNRFPEAAFRMGIDLDSAQFGCTGAKALALNIDHYDGTSWGSFHLITAFEIIEHLENPGQLFRIIRSNLAPGGKVLLSTPNMHALPARLRFLLGGRLPHFDDKSDPTHIYPVYIENLQRIVPRYGLVIEKVFAFPENGYRIFSRSSLFLHRLLKPYAGDVFPGDNIIFLLSSTL